MFVCSLLVCRNTVDFCMFNLCSYELINSRNILKILWKFLDNFMKNKDSFIFPFADSMAFVFCFVLLLYCSARISSTLLDIWHPCIVPSLTGRLQSFTIKFNVSCSCL